MSGGDVATDAAAGEGRTHVLVASGSPHAAGLQMPPPLMQMTNSLEASLKSSPHTSPTFHRSPRMHKQAAAYAAQFERRGSASDGLPALRELADHSTRPQGRAQLAVCLRRRNLLASLDRYRDEKPEAAGDILAVVCGALQHAGLFEEDASVAAATLFDESTSGAPLTNAELLCETTAFLTPLLRDAQGAAAAAAQALSTLAERADAAGLSPGAGAAAVQAGTVAALSDAAASEAAAAAGTVEAAATALDKLSGGEEEALVVDALLEATAAQEGSLARLLRAGAGGTGRRRAAVARVAHRLSLRDARCALADHYVALAELFLAAGGGGGGEEGPALRALVATLRRDVQRTRAADAMLGGGGKAADRYDALRCSPTLAAVLRTLSASCWDTLSPYDGADVSELFFYSLLPEGYIGTQGSANLAAFGRSNTEAICRALVSFVTQLNLLGGPLHADDWAPAFEETATPRARKSRQRGAFFVEKRPEAEGLKSRCMVNSTSPLLDLRCVSLLLQCVRTLTKQQQTLGFFFRGDDDGASPLTKRDILDLVDLYPYEDDAERAGGDAAPDAAHRRVIALTLRSIMHNAAAGYEESRGGVGLRLEGFLDGVRPDEMLWVAARGEDLQEGCVQHRAAVLIQKRFRGLAARRRAQGEREARPRAVLQAAGRGYLCRVGLLRGVAEAEAEAEAAAAAAVAAADAAATAPEAADAASDAEVEACAEAAVASGDEDTAEAAAEVAAAGAAVAADEDDEAAAAVPEVAADAGATDAVTEEVAADGGGAAPATSGGGTSGLLRPGSSGSHGVATVASCLSAAPLGPFFASVGMTGGSEVSDAVSDGGVGAAAVANAEACAADAAPEAQAAEGEAVAAGEQAAAPVPASSAEEALPQEKEEATVEQAADGETPEEPSTDDAQTLPSPPAGVDAAAEAAVEGSVPPPPTTEHCEAEATCVREELGFVEFSERRALLAAFAAGARGGDKQRAYEQMRTRREVDLRLHRQRQDVVFANEERRAELVEQEREALEGLKLLHRRELDEADANIADAELLSEDERKVVLVALLERRLRVVKQHARARIDLRNSEAQQRDRLMLLSAAQMDALESHQAGLPCLAVEVEEEAARGAGGPADRRADWWGPAARPASVAAEEAAAASALRLEEAAAATPLLERRGRALCEAAAAEERRGVECAAAASRARLRLAACVEEEAAARAAAGEEWREAAAALAVPTHEWLERWTAACRHVAAWVGMSEEADAEGRLRVELEEAEARAFAAEVEAAAGASGAAAGLRAALRSTVEAAEAAARDAFDAEAACGAALLAAEAEEEQGRASVAAEWAAGVAAASVAAAQPAFFREFAARTEELLAEEQREEERMVQRLAAEEGIMGLWRAYAGSRQNTSVFDESAYRASLALFPHLRLCIGVLLGTESRSLEAVQSPREGPAAVAAAAAPPPPPPGCATDAFAALHAALAAGRACAPPLWRSADDAAPPTPCLLSAVVAEYEVTEACAEQARDRARQQSCHAVTQAALSGSMRRALRAQAAAAVQAVLQEEREEFGALRDGFRRELPATVAVVPTAAAAAAAGFPNLSLLASVAASASDEAEVAALAAATSACDDPFPSLFKQLALSRPCLCLERVLSVAVAGPEAALAPSAPVSASSADAQPAPQPDAASPKESSQPAGNAAAPAEEAHEPQWGLKMLLQSAALGSARMRGLSLVRTLLLDPQAGVPPEADAPAAEAEAEAEEVAEEEAASPSSEAAVSAGTAAAPAATTAASSAAPSPAVSTKHGLGGEAAVAKRGTKHGAAAAASQKRRGGSDASSTRKRRVRSAGKRPSKAPAERFDSIVMMLSASSLQTNAGLRTLVKAAARVIIQEVRSAEDAQREAALKRSAKAARMRRNLHKHESGTVPLPSSSQQQHQQPKPHPSATFVVGASAPATAAELERRKKQRVADIVRLRERRAAAADEDAARSTLRAAERKARTRLAHDCAATLEELVRLEEEAAAAAAAAEAAAAASDDGVSDEDTDSDCVSTASEASAEQAPCSVAQLLPSLGAAAAAASASASPPSFSSSSSPAVESLAVSPAARDACISAPLRPTRDNEIGADTAGAASSLDRSVDSREARALDFLAQHAVKTQQRQQQQQQHAAPAGPFAPLTPAVLHQPHLHHLGVSPSKSALSSTRAKQQHESPSPPPPPLHDAAPFTLDDMMNDFTFSSMVWSGTASSAASRSPAALRPAAAAVPDAAAGHRRVEGGAVHGAKTVPGHHRQKQPAHPQAQKASARGYTLPPLARTGPWEGGQPRQAPGDERRERLGLVRDAKRHRMFEENSLIGRHAQREDAGADALRDDRAFDATPARPVPAWRLRTLRRCI